MVTHNLTIEVKGKQMVISLSDDGGHQVKAYNEGQSVFFAVMGPSPGPPPIEWVLRTVKDALKTQDAVRPV